MGFEPGSFKLIQLKSRSVPSKYSLVQSPPCRIGIFCLHQAGGVVGGQAVAD